jgi:hypothetical protein
VSGRLHKRMYYAPLSLVSDDVIAGHQRVPGGQCHGRQRSDNSRDV